MGWVASACYLIGGMFFFAGMLLKRWETRKKEGDDSLKEEANALVDEAVRLGDYARECGRQARREDRGIVFGSSNSIVIDAHGVWCGKTNTACGAPCAKHASHTGSCDCDDGSWRHYQHR